MRRREFIAGLASAAAWPVVARAQQAAMPVIGLLSSNTRESDALRMTAFRRGLSETGYVEGRNVAIEYRWAEGQYDLLPEMAASLVKRQVALIFAPGNIAGVVAAKGATTTIPIVFSIGADPVTTGLVASLNRPGGNLTGMTILGAELEPKRLEILHELVPTAAVVGALINPTDPTVEIISRDLRAAARILGCQINVLHASNEREIEAAFATLLELRAGALLIGADAFLIGQSEQLATRALRSALPTIASSREFIVASGLSSYQPSLSDAWHQSGIYTGRILKGEKPGDLPVVQSTKIELNINMRTAKALRLTVPQSILLRADEVIE
jgi:putative tryptophan/tyrosine transport system substrate-binding protein